MRLKTIFTELAHHVPFSFFSAAAGMTLIALITAGVRDVHALLPRFFENMFHVFHPLHIFLSAVATTAMFWRFDRRLFRAVSTGLVGSVGICGLSDIFFPFVGGLAGGRKMMLHVCVVEHPWLILPSAAVGVLSGIVAANALTRRKSTIFSHSSHVLVSTMASLLYLVSFGFTNWTQSLPGVFAIVVTAVLVPCCTSDIVFPLLIASPEAKAHAFCAHGHVHERGAGDDPEGHDRP